MGVFPKLAVCGWLVLALAFTVGPLAGEPGRTAQAQQDPTLPGKASTRPQKHEVDHAEVERLFHEYERLTRGLEPKRVQSIPIRPMAQALEAGPAPGESNKNEGRRLDRLKFDRKYCEHERFRLEQKPTRPIPIVCVVPEGSWFLPDGSWFIRCAPYPRGDFWTPGELQRLYGR
jgi:hypothetical protein